MDNDISEQRRLAYERLKQFTQNRINYYESDTVTVKKLLSKDVVMFAAKGVKTSDEFVDEAFRAIESSSEETVMGNTWQAIIAAISQDTLDTGDLTTVRDGCLYVCELKAQTNTTNSTSFPGELRALRDKVEQKRHFARASNQPIKAAFCVLRSKKAIDEVREFSLSNEYDHTNDDLVGFEYRYLTGAAFWRWLTGFSSAEGGLIDDVSSLDVDEIRKARIACLNKLHMDMNNALSEERLPHTIQGILELKKIRYLS
ncbi:MAG: hypothetical protein LKH08_00035 [Atopobiaceae bacterium]|nr:hypothetical protein [Atopobiaceae bacterium]MCH4119317.1 hypothetical protein [Atopobiaceae bacterium]MCI1431303.1 hypothetical protein [Atopobiaceae bacterium]MCI1470381.1 hypothetical protein [Atopobiaceae bacterium]